MAGSTATPFADAVLRLRGRDRPELDVASFHALPWSQATPGPLRDKYLDLFGSFPAADLTCSGVGLDSFFRPTGPLARAQRLAADAFGSDHTYFLTCGTTTANQVAMDAIDGPGRRILLDRTAHHSLHAAAARATAQVDQAPAGPLLDVEGLVDRLAAAVADGRPYDAVVLAGSSYDGVLYDVPALVRMCRAASPATRTFLVDEAWSAINAFHPELRALGGLAAARAEAGEVRMLVTHSAHKSMNAARQGSYLHVVGEPGFVELVGTCLRGRHTTSPSMPILASLDLARAHAQADGERLVRRGIELADGARRALADDPALKAAFAVVPPPAGPALAADPTKLMVDVSRLELTGEQVRAALFDRHRIYVARVVRDGFLLNFHIGVDGVRVRRLLDALRDLADRSAPPADGPFPEPGTVVDQVIVAYPPGVPVAVPGEVWTAAHQRRVDDLRRDGVDVFALKG